MAFLSHICVLKEDVIRPTYILMKKNGRASCTDPNFQATPRTGGIRELFYPSKGNKVVCFAEYLRIRILCCGLQFY